MGVVFHVIAQTAAEDPTKEHCAAVSINVELFLVLVMVLVVEVMVVLLHNDYMWLGRWLRTVYQRFGCLVDSW